MALAADSGHASRLKRASDIIRKTASSEQALTGFAEIFLSEVDESER